MAADQEIIDTAEERAEKMIEASAKYRTIDDDTVRDVIGHRGSAYLETIDFCGIEDVPVGYRSRYTRRHDYFPDDASEITPEMVADLRDEHEAENRPPVLEPDGFIKLQLRRDGVRFTIYEPRDDFDLDTLASRCNAADVTDLEERGIPVRREGDLYRVYTGTDGLGSYLFPGQLTGAMATGVVPFMLTLLTAVGGFFVGLIVMAQAGGIAMTLTGALMIPLLPWFAYSGTRYGMLFLASLLHGQSTDGSWSSTPYGKNFNGVRDFFNR